MRAWPRVIYLALFVGSAAVAALALNSALRPSLSADLLRAVLVASLCAAPGLIHRKAWPAGVLLLPLGALLVIRTTLALPPNIEGFGAQLSYYAEQLGEGAVLYTQKVFPMTVGDAPALGLFWAVVVYGLTAVGALLALGLRRPLAGLLPPLVLIGFGLTVDETPRLLWAGLLFLLLATCLLTVSRALKRPGWRPRDLLPGLALGALASGIAVLVLGLVPAVAAKPWQDWRAWDPFHAGGPVYAFNWLQNYPQLLDPAHEQPVMEVRSPLAAYWRANALDTFTGYAWVSTQSFRETLPRASSGAETTYTVPSSPFTAPGQPVEQSFRLHSAYTNYFFTGGDPISLQLDREVDIRMNDMRALHVIAALGPTLDYQLLASVPTIRPADLVGRGSDYPEEVEPYRSLPFPRAGQIAGPDAERSWRATVSDLAADGEQWLELFALNRRLVGEATDPYLIALRLERHLRRDYQYNLTPPASPYPSPYAAFLFDTRQGYCQHFAGAMALLLRFNGIPARVAVGFATGREEAPGVFAVTTNNAHAWVEAFFPGIGWVAFDPTPGRNLPTPGPSSTTPGFVDPFPPEPTPGGGTLLTLPPPQNFPGDTLPSGESQGEAGSALGSLSWLPWVGGLIVVALGWPAARFAWQRRHLRHGPPLRRVQASLALSRATLAAYGIAISPSLTLEEVFAVVRDRVGLLPEPDFVPRLQAILFGGRAARPADVERCESFRRRLTRTLRRRYEWTVTLRALYRL